MCGDGLLVGDELCDGELMSVLSCIDLALGGGRLTCRPDCLLDVTSCDIQAQCGNSAVEYPEVCDGGSLAGETCESLGFQTGHLACLPGCDGFDTSDCSYSCNLNCGGPGCDGEPCGANGVFCDDGDCTCLGNGGTPQTVESSCGDHYDNDCNGDVDCADTSCNGDPCGTHGQICSGSTCVCSGNGGSAQSSESSGGFIHTQGRGRAGSRPRCAG